MYASEIIIPPHDVRRIPHHTTATNTTAAHAQPVRGWNDDLRDPAHRGRSVQPDRHPALDRLQTGAYRQRPAALILRNHNRHSILLRVRRGQTRTALPRTLPGQIGLSRLARSLGVQECERPSDISTVHRKIIRLAVTMYVRFPLSLRQAEVPDAVYRLATHLLPAPNRGNVRCIPAVQRSNAGVRSGMKPGDRAAGIAGDTCERNRSTAESSVVRRWARECGA